MYRLFLYFIFLPWITHTYSQIQPELVFHSFLDNREYFNPYAPDKTIFGCRTQIGVNYEITTNQLLTLGLSQLIEFGRHATEIPVVLAYYKAESSWSKFYIGSFPRYEQMDYPLAMLSDTLNYYRPQIEGVLTGFSRGQWEQTVWMDWTSMQAANHRETFLAGTFGKLSGEAVYLKNYFLIYHYAKTSNATENQFIRDNLGAFVAIGFQFRNLGFADQFSLESGYLQGFDRDRAGMGWKYPAGVLTTATVYRRWAGLKLTQYHGDRQAFLYGDGLYKATRYTRVDFMVRPQKLTKPIVDIRVALHIVEGVIDYSQLLSVRFSSTGFSRK